MNFTDAGKWTRWTIAAAMAVTVGVASERHVAANSVAFETDSTWSASGYSYPSDSLYTGPAIVINPQHSAWIAASNFGTAKWIGVETDNATYGYADPSSGNGTYVFTKTLGLIPPPVANSSVDLDLHFSADNYLIGLQISSANATLTVPSATLITLQANNSDPDLGGGKQVWSFKYNWEIQGSAALSSPVTITATVQNWNPDPTIDPNNPMGFIANGTLSYAAVPLPATAGVGFSMLGGFGVLAGVRKLFRRRLHVA